MAVGILEVMLVSAKGLGDTDLFSIFSLPFLLSFMSVLFYSSIECSLSLKIVEGIHKP